MSGPVDFNGAMMDLIADGYTDFLEVGGHPVLSYSMHECFQATPNPKQFIAFPSLLKYVPFSKIESNLFGLTFFTKGTSQNA